MLTSLDYDTQVKIPGGKQRSQRKFITRKNEGNQQGIIYKTYNDILTDLPLTPLAPD